MKKTICLFFACGVLLSAHAQVLICHWDFNGTTDEVLNTWPANTTKSLGTPTPTTGKAGAANTAYKFNAGDNLVFDYHPALNLTDWTITAVVRPDAFYSGTCQISSILMRGDYYSSEHYDLTFFDQWVDDDCYQYYPTDFVFGAKPAGPVGVPIGEWSGNLATNPRLNAGQWYCVTASYNSSLGWLDLWVDGVHVVSEHGSPYKWNNQYSYSNNPIDLFIGSSNGPLGSYPYWFDGAIDDLKLFQADVSTFPVDCEFAGEGTTLIGLPPGEGKSATNIARASEAHMINVSPSPATDIVKVTTPKDWQRGDLSIFNAAGAMVQHYDVDPSGVTTLDVSRLPAGIYVIDAEFIGHSIRKKLVKQ